MNHQDFEIAPAAIPSGITDPSVLNHIGHQQWTGGSTTVLDVQSNGSLRGRSGGCCTSCWAAGCNWLTSAVGVTILLLLYLMMGATMFMLLGNDDAYRINKRSSSSKGAAVESPLGFYDPDGQLMEKTTATVDRLWAITEDLNILYRDNWTHLARAEMRHYQTEIVHTLRRIMLEEHYSIRQTWTFAMSLLYSLTLVTTIGYGFYTPSTVLSRSLTTAYSIVGIPLFLLYLSVVGERMARIIARMACCCCCCVRRDGAGSRRAYQQYADVTLALQPMGNGHAVQLEASLPPGSGSLRSIREHNHPNNSGNCCSNQVPLLMCAGLLAVFVGTGSLLLAVMEPQLSFIDSLHLIVNLLLTLGFAGNVLPGMNAEGSISTTKDPSSKNPSQGSVILLTVLILLGMTLLSSSVNVIMEASKSSTSGQVSGHNKNNSTTATTYHHMPSPSRQIA